MAIKGYLTSYDSPHSITIYPMMMIISNGKVNIIKKPLRKHN